MYPAQQQGWRGITKPGVRLSTTLSLEQIKSEREIQGGSH